MDDEYIKFLLRQNLYKLTKIMVANDNHDYKFIDDLVRKLIDETKKDLEILEGAKK